MSSPLLVIHHTPSCEVWNDNAPRCTCGIRSNNPVNNN
jgi:hypothetical protein